MVHTEHGHTLSHDSQHDLASLGGPLHLDQPTTAGHTIGPRLNSTGQEGDFNWTKTAQDRREIFCVLEYPLHLAITHRVLSCLNVDTQGQFILGTQCSTRHSRCNVNTFTLPMQRSVCKVNTRSSSHNDAHNHSMDLQRNTTDATQS